MVSIQGILNMSRLEACHFFVNTLSSLLLVPVLFFNTVAGSIEGYLLLNGSTMFST